MEAQELGNELRDSIERQIREHVLLALARGLEEYERSLGHDPRGTCKVRVTPGSRAPGPSQTGRRLDVRVMMMIKGDREPGHVPGEELLAEMGKYNEGLSKAGVLLDLAALHWSAEGVRVRYSSGKRTVIDGPFGEPKEIVAGYWILQVKSIEEAIEWAKRVPLEAGGEPDAEVEIEIRQLFEQEELS